MPRSLVVAVVGLLAIDVVVAVAHSGQDAPAPAETGPLHGQPGSGPATSAPSSPGPGAAPSAAGPINSPATSTPPKTPTSPGGPGAYAFTLRVEPSCAKVGDSVTVTATMTPAAELTFLVQYADGTVRDTFFGGYADGAGLVVHSFTVPIGAATGEASIVAGGRDPKTDRKAYTQATFRVAGTRGCR